MTPDPRLTDAHASATMLGRVLILLALLIAAGVIGAVYHHADKDQPWTSNATSTTQQASTATSTHSGRPSTRLSATDATGSTSTGASSATLTEPRADPLSSSTTDALLGWTAVIVAASAVVVQAWRLGHDGGRRL